MTEPTFLVIGTGRSGTTSLHEHLLAHPEVFVPEVKAPSYFYAVDEPDRGTSRRAETRHSFVRDRDAYLALFDGSDRWRARGEVSPAYLAAPRVPERIATELPGARLVAVLRDPSDRLIARFVARRRDGLEPAAHLDEVVDRELASGLDLSDTAGSYVAAGFVSHVLQRYLELFGPEALDVHVFDDLVDDPGAVVAEVFAFIGVDPTVDVAAATRHNASGGVIRDPITRWVWGRSAPLRQRVGPILPRSIRDAAFRAATRRVDPVTIEPSTRRRLAEIYRDEVAAIADLLHRDLGHWGSAGVTP